MPPTCVAAFMVAALVGAPCAAAIDGGAPGSLVRRRGTASPSRAAWTAPRTPAGLDDEGVDYNEIGFHSKVKETEESAVHGHAHHQDNHGSSKEQAPVPRKEWRLAPPIVPHAERPRSADVAQDGHAAAADHDAARHGPHTGDDHDEAHLGAHTDTTDTFRYNIELDFVFREFPEAVFDSMGWLRHEITEDIAETVTGFVSNWVAEFDRVATASSGEAPDEEVLVEIGGEPQAAVVSVRATVVPVGIRFHSHAVASHVMRRLHEHGASLNHALDLLAHALHGGPLHDYGAGERHQLMYVSKHTENIEDSAAFDDDAPVELADVAALSAAMAHDDASDRVAHAGLAEAADASQESHVDEAEVHVGRVDHQALDDSSSEDRVVAAGFPEDARLAEYIEGLLLDRQNEVPTDGVADDDDEFDVAEAS